MINYIYENVIIKPITFCANLILKVIKIGTLKERLKAQIKERKRMFSYREAQSTQAELQWEDKCLQPPACLPLTDFPLVPTLPWRMAFCFVFLAKISKTRPPDKTPIIKPSQLWLRKSKMTKDKQKFGVREETERNSRAQLTFSFPSVLLGKGAMWPAAADSCCLPRHEDGTFKLGARIRLFFFYCFYFLNYLITFTHFIWGQCTGAIHTHAYEVRDNLLESILSPIQILESNWGAFYLMTLFGGPTALLCQVSGHGNKPSNYHTPRSPCPL